MAEGGSGGWGWARWDVGGGIRGREGGDEECFCFWWWGGGRGADRVMKKKHGSSARTHMDTRREKERGEKGTQIDRMDRGIGRHERRANKGKHKQERKGACNKKVVQHAVSEHCAVLNQSSSGWRIEGRIMKPAL